MSHEITEHDTVVLNRQQAWHKLGRVIEEDLTAVEASDKYGLSYPVNSWPVYAKNPITGEFTLIELHQANVRQIETPDGDITRILGVTSDSYQVCQNRQLAELTDAIADSGKVVIESCGTLRGGKLVWFLARGESYNLGGTDKVYPYVLVSNGHDGKQSIKVTPTTIRVVCSNTLHAVLDNKVAAWSCNHLGDVGGKIEAAKLGLRHYEQTTKINQELQQRLAEVRWTSDDALKLFAAEYSREFGVATDEELKSLDAKLRRIAEKRVERQERAAKQFLARFNREQSELGVKGSAWLALNAWTGFVQHDNTAKSNNTIDDRAEQKQASQLFGLSARRGVKALATAQELALAS